jgi:hypothetical protein
MGGGRHRVPQAEYKWLHAEAVRLFGRVDPLGIAGDANQDEYGLEVSTVLPRLRCCDGVGQVRVVLVEEFARWFGERDAGPAERYSGMAEELWGLWLELLGQVGAARDSSRT